MGCVRETPQIKKRSHHGMCKRNSPHKNKVSMGCVRETPQIKKTKKQKKQQQQEHGMCKRNFPHKKTKSAWDV